MKIENAIKFNLDEENFGFLLWQIGELENFYPLYKTMIKKE